MAINSRVILRALALSLLFHTWLLLQVPSRVTLQTPMLIEAELRPPPPVHEQTLPKQRNQLASSVHETRAANVAEIHAPARATATAPVPVEKATPATDFNISEARKSYIFALARVASRIKRTASAAGWEGLHGTSEIRVKVAADGVAQALLQSSSGDARSDDVALTLMVEALAHAAVPTDLRGTTFDLVVPLSFDD